jgi:hypothetical protein
MHHHGEQKDQRSELIEEMEQMTHQLYIAEMCWYKRQLDAIRIKGDRSIIRAEKARKAARELRECINWNMVVMDQAGMDAIGKDILTRCFIKIQEWRAIQAAAEGCAGRLAPHIPWASEDEKEEGGKRWRLPNPSEN